MDDTSVKIEIIEDMANRSLPTFIKMNTDENVVINEPGVIQESIDTTDKRSPNYTAKQVNSFAAKKTVAQASHYRWACYDMQKEEFEQDQIEQDQIEEDSHSEEVIADDDNSAHSMEETQDSMINSTDSDSDEFDVTLYLCTSLSA
ncbi:hypothetical protein DMN91_003541 [Ooceraea biroi]|uniref:Uncharacterized protein n=1 Tax=Ooceraea biroi TaxID=2015173 RepID=A0A3L8DSE0_OOCBI|nr:hypothetical protein DMN91_003541 [Ooceraea biroi]